jgi:hypothetical protein
MGLLLIGILVITSCLTTGNSVQPGKVAEPDSAYLVGQLDVALPADLEVSEVFRTFTLKFLTENGKKEGEIIQCIVPRGTPFFIKLPKGQYSLKTVSFPMAQLTKTPGYYIIGENTVDINLYAIDVNLKLDDVQMAYLGDLKFQYDKNPYGQYDFNSVFENNFEKNTELVDGWLLNDAQESVLPEDISSQLESGIYMESPFSIKSENMGVFVGKDQALSPINDGEMNIEASKSIAFFSADNNYGSWTLLSSLDAYAKKTYDANVFTQEEIAKSLPKYPATFYVSSYQLKTAIGGAKIHEEYNSDYDSAFIDLGKSLGVDYLYVLYKRVGVDHKGNGMFSKEHELTMQMRARLFDIEAGRAVAESLYGGKEKLDDITELFSDGESGIKMINTLTEELVDPLYQ